MEFAINHCTAQLMTPIPKLCQLSERSFLFATRGRQETARATNQRRHHLFIR